MAYCTIADLKAYLRISSDAEDALLTTVVSAAESTVSDYTNRTFGVDTETTTYLPVSMDNVSDNGRVLYLDHHYIELVEIPTSVFVSGTDVTSAVKVYGDAPITQLILSKASGYRFDGRYDRDTEPEEQVAITGLFGYSAEVPDEIKQATLMIAAHLYQAKDREMDGKVNVLDREGKASPPLPDVALAILEPYRKHF